LQSIKREDIVSSRVVTPSPQVVRIMSLIWKQTMWLLSEWTDRRTTAGHQRQQVCKSRSSRLSCLLYLTLSELLRQLHIIWRC